MQVGVQQRNDRRRRQHGKPQTRAGQPEQEEGDQALADDRLTETTADFWKAGNLGAGEGIRTLDPNLGKVVLYP